MGIYDQRGIEIYSAYDLKSVALSEAYDAEGEVVFYSGQSFPLKVMQYNVGQWYVGDHDNVPEESDELYYALQSGIIQAHNADILLLEEYTKQFSKAGRTALSMLESDYPYYHEQATSSTTTVQQRAIYSKYPITNYTTHNWPSQANYYWDSCTITVRGIPIMVACTHLHWNNRTYRAEEAQEIISGTSGAEYFIIGGDFNTTDCFSTSGQDYTSVLKPFVDAGYTLGNCSGFGFIPTYSSNSEDPYTMYVLDNVITKGRITIDNIYTDTTKLTDGISAKVDHLPLIAELTVYQ